MDQLDLLGHEFSRIPWENLTKYLRKLEVPPGRERMRGPLEVFEDHARLGTGGTCFSLTEALGSTLRDLGFRCRVAMADMSHGRDIHCVLLVRMEEGLFVIDPGYLVPVPVELRRDRRTGANAFGRRYEYDPVEGGWNMYTTEAGVRTWRYLLKSRPVDGAEFERHWLRSFEATSMNGLHINRLDSRGRSYVHNHKMRLVDVSGRSSNHNLREGYPVRVSAMFGIDEEVASRAWDRLQESV
ncbi:hypothetical protein GF402_03900 [Candidatus Fermentibacteria bacterium]|nr:hypothetical protein [Candidatus Fermentibacteria bacterium]